MKKTEKETAYYIAEDLKKFGNVSDHVPELGDDFFKWYGHVFEDGALSKKEKSLMALAVALAISCPYCVDAYTKDSMKLGYSAEQMTEAAHVASAIRGGATLVNSVQMKKSIDKKMMR